MLVQNTDINQIIIYINDIDGENINCAFNINLNETKEVKNKCEKYECENQLLIKNQNIFAKIKNTNGTTKNIKAF